MESTSLSFFRMVCWMNCCTARVESISSNVSSGHRQKFDAVVPGKFLRRFVLWFEGSISVEAVIFVFQNVQAVKKCNIYSCFFNNSPHPPAIYVVISSLLIAVLCLAACQEQSFLVSFITDKNCTIISKKHQAYGTKSINFIKEHFDLGNFGIGFAEFKAKLLVTNFFIYHIWTHSEKHYLAIFLYIFWKKWYL